MAERDEAKTKTTHLYLSEEARAMLDELAQAYYPGRPRVQSQTVEKLIRDAHERLQQRRRDGSA